MRDPVLSEALRDRGTTAKLAAALGITSAAIAQWKRVPATQVIAVERFTGIPRHELRSDVFPAPPEQASAA